MKTKSLIFNTAIRLFASPGYEATTTLRVAREIGITEPAVFYYYKNKSALNTAILEAATIAFCAAGLINQSDITKKETKSKKAGSL